MSALALAESQMTKQEHIGTLARLRQKDAHAYADMLQRAQYNGYCGDVSSGGDKYRAIRAELDSARAAGKTAGLTFDEIWGAHRW